MAALKVGMHVKFNDNPACSGVIFEFQDEGMVAGLQNVSEKLVAMGVGCALQKCNQHLAHEQRMLARALRPHACA